MTAAEWTRQAEEARAVIERRPELEIKNATKRLSLTVNDRGVLVAAASCAPTEAMSIAINDIDIRRLLAFFRDTYPEHWESVTVAGRLRLTTR